MRLNKNSQNTKIKSRGLITVLKKCIALPVTNCKVEVYFSKVTRGKTISTNRARENSELSILSI